MAKRKWNVDTIKQVVDGGSPFIQVGYTGPVEKKHKVGEEWTDVHGDTWKQTAGDAKVKVNKQADSIRELVRPRCKVCDMDINLFGDKTDEKIFAKTGMCFSCLEVEESKMRVEGTFKNYERKKMLSNEMSAAKEFREKVVQSIEYLKKDDSKISFVTSNGQIETWSGAQNADILKDAEADLIEVNKHITELKEEISKLK
jgi:hypothetical protein